MTRRKGNIGRFTKRRRTENCKIVNNTVYQPKTKRKKKSIDPTGPVEDAPLQGTSMVTTDNVPAASTLQKGLERLNINSGEIQNVSETNTATSSITSSQENGSNRINTEERFCREPSTSIREVRKRMRLHPDFYVDEQIAVDYANFFMSIEKGPEYVCSCCERKMYKTNVRRLPLERNEVYQKCVAKGIVSAERKEWVCITCHSKLKNNKIPAQAAANDLYLDDLPSCLQDLNVVEHYLITQNLPFMKILSSHVDQQKTLKGNVINVPMKVNRVTKLLPRIMDTDEMTHIAIKRRMSQRNVYVSDYIDTKKVFEALRWLKTNNKFYEDININCTWSVTEAINKVKEIQFESEEYYSITSTSAQCTFDWHKLVSYADIQELDGLRQQVENEGYIPRWIKLDNNCLFRVFKYLVPKVKLKLIELRTLCCDHLEANDLFYKGKKIQDYIEMTGYIPMDNKNNDVYEYEEYESIKAELDVTRKRKLFIETIIRYLSIGMWHDVVSLTILASIFDINVHVITSNGKDIIKVNDNNGSFISVAMLGEFVFLPLNKTRQHCRIEHDSLIETVEEEAQTEVSFATCIQANDLNVTNRTVTIAPGQDGKPQSLISDSDFEPKAFPVYFPRGNGCYYGPSRPADLSLREYFNRNITHYKIPFASDSDYIFTAQYALETWQLIKDLQVALRRVLGTYKGKEINAGLLKNKEVLEEMIDDNEALRFMKNVRRTPSFWLSSYYDAVAMLKQMNKPTWFLTLSAAEAHWPELLKILGREQNRVLTDEDIYCMTWEEKCQLLQLNSITVARHFHQRTIALFKHVIQNHEMNPCGNISEYFYRVEFQCRGSPHLHVLLWDTSSPTFDSDPEELREYIDKYQSCYLPDKDEDPALHNLIISRQKHNHNSKCIDSNGYCRYSFPFFPVQKTMVIMHGEDHMSQTKDKYETLKKRFASAIKKKQLVNWDIFLEHIGYDYDTYISVIIDNSKHQTVILKRDLNAIWINYYNPSILKIWKANMDFQFVLNPYACIVYITSYMMKSEKTMSRMLKGVLHANRKERTEQKMQIAKKIYQDNREVSIQESGYRILSLPLRGSSRSFVFISSQIRPKRKGVMKDPDVLNQLADDDIEVFKSNIFDRYPLRPDEFESMTLAEFAADYDWQMHEPKSGTFYSLKGSGNGYMKLREKANIIRTFRASIHKQPNDFIQSMLILYVPWREEIAYTLEMDELIQLYRQHEQLIKHQQERFEKISTEQMTKALEVFNNYQNQAMPRDLKSCDEDNVDQNHSDNDEEPNHGVEIKTPKVKKRCYNRRNVEKEIVLKPHVLSADEYKGKYKQLTKRQQTLVDFCKRWCLRKVEAVKQRLDQPKPFHIFLHSPAGCGKSFCVSLIQHDFYAILGHLPNVRDRHVLVAITAYTGSAAYNINGMTLHSTFKLPLESLLHYKKLTREQLQLLKELLGKVILLIIDEISLVNPYMLRFISHRLQEILGTYDNVPFGGINVIVSGDLMQLSPVRANAIYTLIEPCYPGATPDLWNLFIRHELTEVMRQTDDPLKDILLRVRIGVQTVEDLELLKSRQISKLDSNYPLNTLHVFATRAEVASHNLYVVRKLRNLGQRIYKLQNKYMEGHVGNWKYGSIELCENCPVLITINIDVTEGIVNGTMGFVRRFIMDDDEEVETILVEFADPTIGKSYKGNHQWSDELPNTVPITKEEYFDRKRSNALSIIVNDLHFPILPGWASTIHKVQGLTLDKIVVGMRGGLKQSKQFKEGQAYVALSRVRTLNDLQILDFDPKQLISNKTTEEGIRNMAIFHNMMYYTKMGKLQCSLGLINVRGLQTNLPHMKFWLERRVKFRPMFIAMTELKAHHDHFNDQDYNIYIAESVFQYREKAQVGLAVHKLSGFNIENYMLNLEGFHTDIGLWKLSRGDQALLVMIVYRSALDNLQTFEHLMEHLFTTNAQLLDDIPMIACGDMNHHNCSSIDNIIMNTFVKQGFEWMETEATTKFGSCLDHIYVRNILRKTDAEVKEAFFTDHSGVFFSFDV